MVGAADDLAHGRDVSVESVVKDFGEGMISSSISNQSASQTVNITEDAASSSKTGKKLKMDLQFFASKKTGPKPKGTGAHNLKIEEVANQVDDGIVIAGGGKHKEKLISTPEGKKSGRRPDVLVERPDGTLYGINVGRTRVDGTPIKREAEALDDLINCGKLPMKYVPYDK